MCRRVEFLRTLMMFRGLAIALLALTPVVASAQSDGPAAPEPTLERIVPGSAEEITLSFAPVVKSAAPAVVNVHSAEQQQERRSPFIADPLMRRFFGQRQRRRGTALGSGVVVDAGGLVITNAHVVGNARELRVSFNDRREYVASLLLKDERTDLAVLRIDADGPFPHITFGDPRALEVGDLVLAIGNPFGVGQTVTQGIISALARTQVGVADYRFFIQTDAAINPGNSGGALIDMSGRLMGINTAIYSRSGGSNGIGFAIPADMVEIVVRSAAKGGTVQRPWFGARMQSMTRDLARQYGLDRPTGALVVNVLRESPALRAGVKVGDIIVRLADTPINDHDTFGYVFATKGTSGTVALEVLRGGKSRVFSVALEAPPETRNRDARRIGGRSPFTGIIAMNLSPKVADELSIDLASEGVAIARVDQRSIAERVGLRTGDIVVEVNGETVDDTRMLESLASEDPIYWDIIISRDGKELALTLGG
ncbi:MAG: Do family serine endopeptidase [Pseudomonadota bacterium]